MPVTITWHEIVLRLALAVVAGGFLGLDRGERGRAAGIRTTLLVCLAATFAMLLANSLLATTGKAADSFVNIDPMRLPLGILTGMGFIGGGAILRRDNLVVGLTTAATLWFVTVMGLCFGGGQMGLGLVTFALGALVLTGLRRLDHGLRREQYALLHLTTERDAPHQEDIRALAQKAGYEVTLASVTYDRQKQQRELEFRLQWRAKPDTSDSPAFLRDLAGDPHVVTAEWKLA